MNIDKFIKLSEGEEILQEVEGDAQTLGSGPLDKLIAVVTKVLDKVLGRSSKVMIIITNKRIISIASQKIFFVIDKGVDVVSYTPRSINYIGYALVKEWIIFNTRYFKVSTINGETLINFKGSKEELFDLTEKATSSLDRLG